MWEIGIFAQTTRRIMGKMSIIAAVAMLCIAAESVAQDNIIHDSKVKSFKAEVNGDWSLPPLIKLGSSDVLNISFDRLGHYYDEMRYTIRHCDWDWTESEMFEIDFLEGFNDNDIEDYEASVNTTVEYTHYSLDIPNSKVKLKLSGNYIVDIHDEDGNPVAEAKFMVLDQKVTTGAEITPNTLVDNNKAHQQLNITILNPGYTVRIPQNELKVVVKQNESPFNTIVLTKPTYIGGNKIEYANLRELVFEAGNEFRRFEMLNGNDPMMGVSDIKYFAPYYHVTLDVNKAHRSYRYDEDQNGNFIIRNNNVSDSSCEADYMLVHFTLACNKFDDTDVYIYGELTNNCLSNDGRMIYNEEARHYEKTLLLKQGLYNYRYLTIGIDGKPTTRDIEGNFYETENEYSIYVYHRAFGERYDKLVGFSHIYSR